MSRIMDYMSQNVICGNDNELIKDIAQRMKTNKVGVIVIVNENNEINGIISERDIINKVVCEDLQASKVLVKEIMTKKVITGTPDMNLVKTATLFSNKGIKKMPIVDNHKLVGIITQTDLLKILTFKWAI